MKAFAVLVQRNYGLYTLGSTVSLLGLWSHKLAAAWLAWDLTDSSFWVGAVAFADLVPTILLTAYAGVIADRYDRRLIALWSQVFGMLQAFVIGWMVLTGKFTEHDDIWWLFGLTFLLGIVWSFNTAARLSMVPNLVEHRDIPQAVALNSAIFNLARVVGPAIAGYIMAQWGVGEAFLFNGVTFVAFIAALAVVRQVRTEESLRGRGGALAQSLEGFTYARNHPGIGPMLLVLVALAIGSKSLLELLPEFADHVFARGTQGLSELTVAAGAGALIASIWLAARSSVDGLTRLTILSLLVSGLGIAVFTATAWYPLALAGVFFIGAAGVFGGTGTQTLMQHVVAGGLRGRVMSLYGVIYRGGPALGAIAMGAMAEIVGVRAAVATGALLCIGVWLWLVRRQAGVAAALEAPRE